MVPPRVLSTTSVDRTNRLKCTCPDQQSALYEAEFMDTVLTCGAVLTGGYITGGRCYPKSTCM